MEMNRRIHGKGLPRHVVLNRGWYFHKHPVTRKWSKLAREGEMDAMYRALSDILAGDNVGTMNALFDRYEREIIPKKAVKTQADNLKQMKRLRAWCGMMPQGTLSPSMIGRYLGERDAPYAANREIALLSHVHTVAIGRWYLIETNPCVGVERNEETARAYDVPDSDLMQAWLIAKPWMRALMALAYVTGARKMDAARFRETDFGRDGLTFVQKKTQKKTGGRLTLEWTPSLRAARAYAIEQRPVAPIGRWLICNARGQPYTARTLRKEWERIMALLAEQGGSAFQFKDIRPRSASDHKTGEHLGNSEAVREKHYRLRGKRAKPL